VDTEVEIPGSDTGCPDRELYHDATEAMMEYVDIYPTVVELASLPTASDLDWPTGKEVR
jgi:hypothetical protein